MLLSVAFALVAVGLLLGWPADGSHCSATVTRNGAAHVSTAALRAGHTESAPSATSRSRQKLGAAAPLRVTASVRTGSHADPQWVGRFSSWQDASIWPYANYCTNPSTGCTAGISGPHVFRVKDPLCSGRTVLEYNINDRDVPYDGSTGARGDVESPKILQNGGEYFLSLPVMFPTGFPRITSAWFQVGEIYGLPTGCAPPVNINLYHNSSGDHLMVARGGLGVISTFPALTRNRWHTIILHVKMSTDPSVGFVQAWYDGIRQRFIGHVTTYREPTLIPNCNWNGSSPDFLNIDSYRKYGGYRGNVILYHGEPGIGPTYASVYNTLANPPYGP